MLYRYDRDYTYGTVTFYLSDFKLDLEECRLLMLKILEQSIRDYCGFRNSTLTVEKEIWENARDFIFDDEYQISWGNYELTTEEFLDIVDLDITWVRDQVSKKFNGVIDE